MSPNQLRVVGSEHPNGRELADTYTQFREASERIDDLLSNLVLENEVLKDTIDVLNEELLISRERGAEVQKRNDESEALLASARTDAKDAAAAASLARNESIKELQDYASVAIRRLDGFRRFQVSELQASHRRDVEILRNGSLSTASQAELSGELSVEELIEVETQKAQYLVDEGEWVDVIVAAADEYSNSRPEPLPSSTSTTYVTQGQPAVLVLAGDSLAVAGWPDFALPDARRELIRSLVLLAESSALQMDVLMGSDASADLTQGLPMKVRVRILREGVSVGDTLTAISETYSGQDCLIVASGEEFHMSGIAPRKFAQALRSLAASSDS